MKTIYVDFNSVDEEGCVRLNCTQTLNDIETQSIQLKAGLKLNLTDNQMIVEGRVQYSKFEDIWVALINWSDIKSL